MNEQKQHLISLLTQIEEPENYFRGLNSEGTILPENVLVFQRSTGSLQHINDNNHHRFLMIISLKGSGNAIINSSRFHLLPGQGFLVFPHQFHHIKHDVKDINWMMITFEFKTYSHIENLRNTIFDLTEHSIMYLKLLAERYTQLQSMKHRYDIQCSLLMGLFLDNIKQHEATYIKEVADIKQQAFELVDQINQYIDSNIEHCLTVDIIAEKFGYSASHIRLLYRKAMGFSIGSYIKQMKMRTAQKLLLSHSCSICEISTKVGYDSVYAFSRAFKEHIGLAPKYYRKKISIRDF